MDSPWTFNDPEQSGKTQLNIRHQEQAVWESGQATEPTSSPWP